MTPWMSGFVKKIKCKNEIYKTYIKNGFTDNSYPELQDAINVVTEIINTKKQEYYDQLVMKLINPKTSFKAHWSILKTFYNGKNIQLIQPLLINNCLISMYSFRKHQ